MATRKAPTKPTAKETGSAAKKRSRSAVKTRPRTPGRRAQNKEATRQRIVEAALELFEKKGFDETTTKAIARKARVAEGTVFNYFPTKDDIALHFFEQEVDHAIETVRSNARLRKAPLEEKLFALVQSQIDYLAPYEQFIGASLVQALRPRSRMAYSARSFALRNRYVAFVQELIEESSPELGSSALSWIAPQAFWLYYLGVLLYWLHDTTPGKQSTLAFLDRSLQLGVAVLRKSKL